jgi:hypothetical protein
MKKVWLLLLLLTIAVPMSGQTPSQVKQIISTQTSQDFSWTYLTADEASMDSFVIQRSQFAATTVITSPYSVETVIAQKTARQVTYTLPTGLVAGQKAFFRIVARKQGLTDSAPSNVVEIDVVATPPAPSNFQFGPPTP